MTQMSLLMIPVIKKRYTPPQSIEILQIHQSLKKLTFFSNSGEIPTSSREVRVRVSGLPVGGRCSLPVLERGPEAAGRPDSGGGSGGVKADGDGATSPGGGGGWSG